MGRVVLVWRLILRDLRMRPVEAVVFLVAMTAASATLALGIALNGSTDTLYAQTRAATSGPDLVAWSVAGQPGAYRGLISVAHAKGVAQRSGPYSQVYTTVKANGYAVRAVAEGRPAAPAALDRPLVTSGTWLRPGGVVVERAFARALRLTVGDRITVSGRVFGVVGVAVSAASGEFPWSELTGPAGGPSDYSGRVWLTSRDARAMSSPYPRTYVLNMRLASGVNIAEFEGSYRDTALPVSFVDWTVIRSLDVNAVRGTEPVLDIGAVLLGFLAVAGVAGLAAGRAVQQRRRAGLLKAAGAGPGLIAATLLAEYLLLALLAAAAGLLAGWLGGPALSDPNGGLTGSLRPPAAATIAWVSCLAVSAAGLTTLVPALRSARATAVRALADSARPPRRGVLTGLSLHLPAPVLLGIQLTARRPLRTFLHAAGIMTTVAALVAALTYFAQPPRAVSLGAAALADTARGQGSRMLVAVIVVLVLLATANIVVIGWTTVLETRRQLAIARTLGATPGQVTLGICLGQVLPALPAALIGIPAGFVLDAVSAAGSWNLPPGWWSVMCAVAVIVTVGMLTAIPARIMASRPAAQILGAA